LNLSGHVEVRDGVARFSNLSFNAPGASARMSGIYNLLNEQIDLHGTPKTEARLSQDTSGIKSVLLKPFDPLFKGKKAGAEVPVKITGIYQNPQFGFDVMASAQSARKVHHLCSRSLLGDDASENLITLCADCHSDVHFRVAGGAGLLGKASRPKHEVDRTRGQHDDLEFNSR
jgi:hypothetical protein